MPNLLPKGIFARITAGAGAEPADMKASVPGSSVPQTVIEVWASGADHVPQLVWANSADAPTGVNIAYNSATVAVTVTWVPHIAPTKADRYEVRRPDGSLAATVMGAASNSYVDTAPRGLNGAYTVTAVLVGQIYTVSSAPVASNVLDLRPVAPTGLHINYTPTQVNLSWTPNPNRMAYWWYIYRPDGSLAGTPTGRDLAAWSDIDPRPLNGSYVIYAVTLEGVASLTTGTTPSLDLTTQITGLAATWSYTPVGINAGWHVNISWGTPAWGQPDNYQILIDGAYWTTVAGSATSASYPGPSYFPPIGTVHNVLVAAVLSNIYVPAFPNVNTPPRP